MTLIIPRNQPSVIASLKLHLQKRRQDALRSWAEIRLPAGAWQERAVGVLTAGEGLLLLE